jgi:hypothetical protein
MFHSASLHDSLTIATAAAEKLLPSFFARFSIFSMQSGGHRTGLYTARIFAAFCGLPFGFRFADFFAARFMHILCYKYLAVSTVFVSLM